MGCGTGNQSESKERRLEWLRTRLEETSRLSEGLAGEIAKLEKELADEKDNGQTA